MKLVPALLTAWLAAFTGHAATPPKTPAAPKDYLITQFGASLDSTKLNTKAIQQTIDKASAAGGGTIVVPKGVFLSGALFCKPGTHLRVLAGGKLKGSDNIADYPLIPSRMEGQKLDYYAALVNATKVNGFTITGPGTIDGNGLKFWKAFWAHRDSMTQAHKPSTNLEVHRPRQLPACPYPNSQKIVDTTTGLTAPGGQTGATTQNLGKDKPASGGAFLCPHILAAHHCRSGVLASCSTFTSLNRPPFSPPRYE